MHPIKSAKTWSTILILLLPTMSLAWKRGPAPAPPPTSTPPPKPVSSSFFAAESTFYYENRYSCPGGPTSNPMADTAGLRTLFSNVGWSVGYCAEIQGCSPDISFFWDPQADPAIPVPGEAFDNHAVSMFSGHGSYPLSTPQNDPRVWTARPYYFSGPPCDVGVGRGYTIYPPLALGTLSFAHNEVMIWDTSCTLNSQNFLLYYQSHRNGLMLGFASSPETDADMMAAFGAHTFQTTKSGSTWLTETTATSWALETMQDSDTGVFNRPVAYSLGATQLEAAANITSSNLFYSPVSSPHLLQRGATAYWAFDGFPCFSNVCGVSCLICNCTSTGQPLFPSGTQTTTKSLRDDESPGEEYLNFEVKDSTSPDRWAELANSVAYAVWQVDLSEMLPELAAAVIPTIESRSVWSTPSEVSYVRGEVNGKTRRLRLSNDYRRFFPAEEASVGRDEARIIAVAVMSGLVERGVFPSSYLEIAPIYDVFMSGGVDGDGNVDSAELAYVFSFSRSINGVAAPRLSVQIVVSNAGDVLSLEMPSGYVFSRLDGGKEVPLSSVGGVVRSKSLKELRDQFVSERQEEGQTLLVDTETIIYEWREGDVLAPVFQVAFAARSSLNAVTKMQRWTTGL